MNFYRAKGFTLIELLTVIAIIAILAGLIMTVGPRMIERAKIRRLDSALRQVSTALAAYYVDHSTYPPAYGYVGLEQAGNTNAPADPAADPNYYNLVPYMHRLRYHGVEEMYDEFSMSYDTMNEGRLRLLEYSPHGNKTLAGTFEFRWNEWPRYLGANTPGLSEEINRQLTASKRPFIYIPVNKQQFARAQRYWHDIGDEYARNWNPDDAAFPQGMVFPPRFYDAFVLISVGPAANTFGLLPDPLGVPAEQANNSRDIYHITALRAYYLATRDLNKNGLLDFDFRARTQQGEAGQSYPVGEGGFGGRTINNQLPPETNMRDGAGPYIYVSN